MNAYILSVLCIFFFMCFMFVLAQLKKDNSIVDIGWGIGFIIVAWTTFAAFGDKRLHQKLVTFLVTIWGVRLSVYIAVRNWGKPEDFRYANWRKEWESNFALRSFFQVFMLQGLIMFIVLLPVIIINNDTNINNSYKFLYPIGSLIWLFGFFFESVGDWEMYLFKSDPHPHKSKIMNRGLWKYTRHPNYFGEAIMWWGIFLLAFPSGLWYISLLAPVTLTFLLLKVSGVTMLEKKYEGNDEYSGYKKRTSAFLPWFPKR